MAAVFPVRRVQTFGTDRGEAMTAALRTEDPASAIAMGRCLTARVLDPAGRSTPKHPGRYGWCDYPTQELGAGIAAFTAWAEFDDRRSTSGRHATRVFAELPRDEQEALIAAAQAFEEPAPLDDLPPGVAPLPARLPFSVPPAQPVPSPEPPQPVVDEAVPWLRGA